MLWMNETINMELDKCEQGADINALIVVMRDEYEAALAAASEHAARVDALYIERGKRIVELEAHLEDRERTINALSGELANYERIVTEYSATLAAQHDKIEWLEPRLTLALATIEKATEDAGGSDYAEGFAP